MNCYFVSKYYGVLLIKNIILNTNFYIIFFPQQDVDSSRLPLKDDQNVNEEIQALVKKHLDETRLVQGTSILCSGKLAIYSQVKREIFAVML